MVKVSATIPSWHTRSSESERPYTLYDVQIKVGEITNTRKIRYSELRELHKKLSSKNKLLSFPSRRLVTNNQDPRFIESRRKGLEQFIQEVLRLQPIPQALWHFLNIDQTELKKKVSKVPDMMAFKETSSVVVPAAILTGVCSGIRIYCES